MVKNIAQEHIVKKEIIFLFFYRYCLIRNNSLSLSYYTNPLKNEFTFTQIKETNSEMVYFIS
jgi:hypothetical protein